MPVAQLAPNDRYAFVGKTGSGKTQTAIVLAGTFALSLPEPWQVWWVDTKNDPKDLRTLRQWGFRNIASKEDQSTGLPAALYWLVKPKSSHDDDTVEQVQAIIGQAYSRGHVLLVIDEYAQVVPSPRTAGSSLLNAFQRGRGKNVGIIGLTQEPVFVPRQLLSQASHLVLFTLSYARDIDYVKQFNKAYAPPGKLGDRYGFYWQWVDGNGEWSYFPNQKIWYNQLMVAQPKLVTPTP